MGQHAEDIINGDVDQFTGEWLGGGQGYPGSDFDDVEPSTGSKTRGIEKYIRKHIGTEVKYHKVINDFFEATGKKIKGSHRRKAAHISDFCFPEFAKYIQQVKQKL
jgi:hypothetical protein